MKKIKFPTSIPSLSFIAIILLLTSGHLISQTRTFTKQDSLRGSVTPEREWWDLTWYHLNVRAFPEDSSLQGNVVVQYRVLTPGSVMQIDLQQPMNIINVVQDGEAVEYTRTGNVYYLHFEADQGQDELKQLNIFYEGKPVVSKQPPWDGGMVWRRDDNGNHFIATACQGEGASLWWPCKDHMYDEPDSMLISITAPANLTSVGNGRLIKMEKNRKEKTRTFHWSVVNPINNYGVNINIGDYVHYSEIYAGEKGDLDCDYYVLPYNLEKAKKQFLDVPRMLEAFEYWFGPYPFYEDGYKLVEVPYPGMEHQSSVTYGNMYKNGFMGRDVSHTGWGDKFDFIIIHESGHEWFANNITYIDIADMWVHEGFTAYSESLFTEYFYGKDAGYAYVRGTRANISNARTIIGTYDVNHAGSGDMYSKGANMLHTIRQLVGSDSTWRALLRDLNRQFYHQTVTTQEIEEYMIEFTGIDLSSVFDQYLRDIRIPVLEYEIMENSFKYRWSNCVDGFDMPVIIRKGDEEITYYPTTSWKFETLKIAVDEITIDPDFYVASIRL